MANNPLMFEIISNTSDITACIFLIILLVAMAVSDNKELVPNLMSGGTTLMLTGLLCRLMARVLSRAALKPGNLIAVSDNILELIRIAGFVAILMGTILFFICTEQMYSRGKASVSKRKKVIAAVIFLSAVIAAYLLTRDDRVWSITVMIVIIFSWIYSIRLIDRTSSRVFFTIPIAGVFLSFLILLMFPEFKVTGIGLALMYVILYIQHTFMLQRELASRELELADSRIRLLTGQISPHFMFNSLQVIQALCDTDPGEVKGAIGRFASYLRGNLESLTAENLIPFGRELEHTRAYISLEQLGAGRSFEVSYEMGIENFMLPPLTLQPLVENAVRYGIGTRSEGDSIVIRTWDDQDAIYVSVIDNGHGRTDSTDQQKKRRSIGIENVRARLEAQCGGSLYIDMSEAGTTATIELPKAFS